MIKHFCPWLANIDHKSVDTFLVWLDSLGSDDEVILLISSRGGQTKASFKLFDFVQERRLQLRAIGLNKVSSAAIPVFLAGQQRIVFPGTEFLFHDVAIQLERQRFTSKDLVAKSEMLLADRERYAELVAGRTSLTKADVFEMMDREVTIGSDEAVRLGLAEAVIRPSGLFSGILGGQSNED